MYELINFIYSESDNTDGLFTKNHKKYNVTIEYKGKSFTCEYQCNKNAEVRKEDVITCILMDAETIWYGFDSLDWFMVEYSYPNKKEAQKVYKLCKRASKALEGMFTEAEIEMLEEESEEYR